MAAELRKLAAALDAGTITAQQGAEQLNSILNTLEPNGGIVPNLAAALPIDPALLDRTGVIPHPGDPLLQFNEREINNIADVNTRLHHITTNYAEYILAHSERLGLLQRRWQSLRQASDRYGGSFLQSLAFPLLENTYTLREDATAVLPDGTTMPFTYYRSYQEKNLLSLATFAGKERWDEWQSKSYTQFQFEQNTSQPDVDRVSIHLSHDDKTDFLRLYQGKDLLLAFYKKYFGDDYNYGTITIDLGELPSITVTTDRVPVTKRITFRYSPKTRQFEGDNEESLPLAQVEGILSEIIDVTVTNLPKDNE